MKYVVRGAMLFFSCHLFSMEMPDEKQIQRIQEALDFSCGEPDRREIAFKKACEKKNYDFVDEAIQSGFKVDSALLLGVTALMLVAREGNKLMFDKLLKHGADITKKDEFNESVLTFACQGPNHEIVQYCCNQGLDPNNKDTLGSRPIHYAARHGNSISLPILFLNDAKMNVVNNDGLTPAMLASQHGHLQSLRLLHSSGAHLNIVGKSRIPSLIWGEECEGKTALSLACSKSQSDIIQFLCKQYACDQRAYECDGSGRVQLCRPEQSILYLSDYFGMTPLMLLAQNSNNTELAKLILRMGDKEKMLTQKCKQGLTAADHARLGKNVAMEFFLCHSDLHKKLLPTSLQIVPLEKYEPKQKESASSDRSKKDDEPLFDNPALFEKYFPKKSSDQSSFQDEY